VAPGGSGPFAAPGQGAALRDALRAAGVEVAYHAYRGEDHALARPEHRADYLRRLLAWFDRHLRGSGG
jgi:dipeptidyl aminopeptidase/acylaminoacyl peptidase